MNKRYMFVGERPSISAWKFSKQWSDGAYAGKQLKDAIDEIDCLEFADIVFCNLWIKPKGISNPAFDVVDLDKNLDQIFRYSAYWIIVGMGKIVQEKLDEYGIKHLKLIHPAARGKIRRKDRYLKHCRSVLCQEVL